jgi:hypothetical protein
MPVQLTKRLLESSTIRALGDPETNTRFAEVITGFDRNERYSQKLLSVAETRGNIMVDTTKPASNKMSGNQGEGNREAVVGACGSGGPFAQKRIASSSPRNRASRGSTASKVANGTDCIRE